MHQKVEFIFEFENYKLVHFVRTVQEKKVQANQHLKNSIIRLEGKYSVESTDPHESEIRAPP